MSKFTVEPELGRGTALLTAELDATHTAPRFAELGVRPEITRALGEIGIERTFAIQELTLPLALAGEDLIGQARTGMGKTFAFGVPMLQRITSAPATDSRPRALVIVPTRELCIQVTADLDTAGKYVGGRHGTGPARICAIYGGRPYESQIEALRTGVDVVVGTPGRLLDLADQHHLVLDATEVLVLDEADEMLDLGFLPDVERILGMVPQRRQTMLFSATMPDPIITLARAFLSRPTHIRAEEPSDSAVHERTSQFVYRAHALDKTEVIARVLQARGRGATMIFARTKRTAQKVADDLADRGFAVTAVHGDLGQIARERSLDQFRRGAVNVLVATDVAARGIDIDDVTHVINFQCPDDEKIYVHRIGRTGRAGRSGVAVTLVDWDELKRWEGIDAALGLGIPEPVETYSSSAHLYSDLDIPEEVSGALSRRRTRRDPDAEVGPRQQRERRKRPRRRTRGGQLLAAEADSAPADGSAVATGEGESEHRTRPRRRRGPRSKPAAAEDNSTAAAPEAPPTGGAPEADPQRPRRRRRRRRPAAGGTSDTDGGSVATTAVPA